MARTVLPLSNVALTGLADPTGTAGNVDGHKFANDDRVMIRVVNARALASAVWTVSTDDTLTGGNWVLQFLLGIKGNTPKVYTTGTLAHSISPANAALAVLAATAPDGHSVSTDIVGATCTGGGAALSAGGPMTLTFGGALANWPVPAPSIATSALVGGDANVALTTPGTGWGVIGVPVPHPYQGFSTGPQYLSAAGGGAKTFFGPFPTAIFNQAGADTGDVYLNYDNAADYTVTAFKI